MINISCANNYTRLTIISLLLLTFTACKKDKKADCLLTDVVKTSNDHITNANIYYNDEGKATIITQTGFEANSLTLSYKDNTVLIYEKGTKKDSLTLNAAGYVTNTRLFAGTSWLNWQYNVNTSNETLGFILTTSQGTTIANEHSTYINGNLTEHEDTKYIYDTGKPSKPGDALRIGNLLSLGLQNPVSKNLVTGQVNAGDTTFFKYTYDSQDRITELKIVNAKTGTSTGYNYSYNCK